ncbi:MAG: 1-acyl-sn-glycerol-3-phosphate acyltransferase [Leptolyngbyaceae cyanobacterium SL_7_1]|nr:1-acyl-sn-glycerol-3-phosphate acyltransferase [Leptolyngbyaceae cyanobacterium SL_7_1]
MDFFSPLWFSRQLLAALNTELWFHYQERVPRTGSIVVVSNHRSFMDAPLLMAALNQSMRFACHHYMGQVPIMKDIVTQLGCFPLDTPEQRRQSFFTQAIRLLHDRQVVGIFPEGAEPMVALTQPENVGTFHRGFAHLALRAPIADLTLLPVAIASQKETINSAIPLSLLSVIDPSEPLFQQSGWHPMVVYERVNVLIGRPMGITASQRQSYQGKQAKTVIADLTEYCHTEIKDLLQKSY